jgi:hypothetical protein
MYLFQSAMQISHSKSLTNPTLKSTNIIKKKNNKWKNAKLGIWIKKNNGRIELQLTNCIKNQFKSWK